MIGIVWAVGELDDAGLLPISAEIGTVARQIAGAAGLDVRGVVVGTNAEAGACQLASYIEQVVWLDVGGADGYASPSVVSSVIGSLLDVESSSYVFLSATRMGRDLAGMLLARTGWGVLANAVALEWDDGPVARVSALGGKYQTRCRLTAPRGIVTVRPGVTASVALASPGAAKRIEGVVPEDPKSIRRIQRVRTGTSTAVDNSRIVVAGGAGVGSKAGWSLVESLAEALHGAVGATRLPVDSGWVSYSQQIGQTGKIIRPELYVALGISGAVQHKVGMQMATNIVAINTDREAPIAQLADVMAVGDLHVVVPRLLRRLDERPRSERVRS